MPEEVKMYQFPAMTLREARLLLNAWALLLVQGIPQEGQMPSIQDVKRAFHIIMEFQHKDMLEPGEALSAKLEKLLVKVQEDIQEEMRKGTWEGKLSPPSSLEEGEGVDWEKM